MTGKPINLNKARKARERAEKRRKADENAVRFGRTRAQKARDADATARLARHLDDSKREE